jgi:hypothetical protein
MVTDLHSGLQLEDTALTVVSPLNYQVFQRDTDNRALVPIAIKTQLGRGQISARLVLLPVHTAYQPYAGQTTAWVHLSQTQGGYAGEALATAGGWYRLEVRCQGKNGEEILAVVQRVGIGDVFICAGQSNGANSGWPPQVPHEDRVVAFDGQTWRLGHDPQPMATNTGGSPWPILGDLLVRSLQVPIAFAAVNQGGSRVESWHPRGELYPLLAGIAKAHSPHGARAVLWHQGYANSGYAGSITAEDYAKSLAMTIAALNDDAGYTLPWVVAQEGIAPYWKTDSQAVRNGQQLLWERGLAYQGPLTDDLVGPKFRHDVDHFNELGLRIHAERWFALLFAQFYAVAPMHAGTP